MINQYRYYFTFLIFILVHFSVAAQNFHIKGQVKDAETNEPLPMANVRVFKAADSTLVTGQATEISGEFDIPISEGDYYLLVDYMGYEGEMVAGVSISNTSPLIDLSSLALRPDHDLLSDVEIVAERPEMELKLDKRVYNISQNIDNKGRNAADILDNLPSVNVDIVDGSISLRGSENVRILINGKPSGLTSKSEALRSLQGTMIERIEIITNPSAKYEAEGEAGIINIVLKKNQKNGFNGSFDANVGWPRQLGAAYNINYRNKKVNLFSSFGADFGGVPGGGTIQQEFYREDTSYYYIRDREHRRANAGINFRLGMDYFITENLTLTGAGLISISRNRREVDINYQDFSQENILGREIRREQREVEEEQDLEFNLNLKKTFERKGHEWITSGQYRKNNDLEDAKYDEFGIFNDQSDIDQNSFNTENQESWLLQSDYIHPFGKKGKFEAGLRADQRIIDNDYLVEELDSNGNYQPLPDFDNHFIYEENIQAAYAILSNERGDFNWQIGLRAEHTNIRTELLDTDSVNTQNYTNLFPSAFLSYKLSKQQSLQLSYSRRINRPRFRYLLPFSNFSDSRNFWGGNPALQPEFTDSYEAAYLYNWERGNLLASVYYRHRQGVIQRIKTIDENDFTISQPVNLAVQDAVGIEFSANYDLRDWWTLSANGNFFRAETTGSFEGQDFGAIATTFEGRIVSKLKLRNGLDIQATLLYDGPQNRPQGYRKSITHMNLGITKDIFAEKGSLTLSVRDLFNTRKWRFELAQEGYYEAGDFQWRSRQVTLAINYRLNQEGKANKRKSRY